ncbi:lysine N(6)-hydroxylase/L-ornithine N(5)-oxygenase family protein [Lentzea flaviverrucosa]|uniref:L-lysine N6-monooxygenase MbtG n=1 Tax=Lentzea flaviverrucosa TaxID=200379 RepID=A0A1H9SE89_9PSEU|nr:SidA/IucD/PvdA family monooxygenase [Lentzea flaviverrucosa]RDI25337.1 L-ornithine N5-oxygenase [Lentzea flaviverrucosa]SER83291.1 L-ornithine N5-oxygenase [Lentzea flaviverrucosa]
MTSEPYDVVGIGFGPSNLSLAIALEETGGLSAAFFEKQDSLRWHSGMLVPGAKMQVSFLKDLATPRNPVSSYSFVSYLHDRGRFARFVNNSDFFPTRREFQDYLRWAEARLSPPVHYRAEVVSVRRAEGVLRVHVRDTESGATRTVDTRNIVISTGLVPRMPVGLEAGESVWHSSQFLHRFHALGDRDVRRVAVVGAGQSAAELVRYLHENLPSAQVFAVLPSYGYAIADSTPFANEVFDADAVDVFYDASDKAKAAIWRYHRNTNYSVVDDEVIRDLYQRAYDDEVRGEPRLRFLPLTRVVGAKQDRDGITLLTHSTVDDQARDLPLDLVVCATGYDPMDPGELLAGLGCSVAYDELGRHLVGRDHRLVTEPDQDCGIYLQGGTEHTHGLTSSLLSNIAVRGGEITQSILRRRAEQRNGAPA